MDELTGCRGCGHPEKGHGLRYVALQGEHAYIPPRDTRPVNARTTRTGPDPVAAFQRPATAAPAYRPGVVPTPEPTPDPAPAAFAAAHAEAPGRAPGAFARFLHTLKGNHS